MCVPAKATCVGKLKSHCFRVGGDGAVQLLGEEHLRHDVQFLSGSLPENCFDIIARNFGQYNMSDNNK